VSSFETNIFGNPGYQDGDDRKREKNTEVISENGCERFRINPDKKIDKSACS